MTVFFPARNTLPRPRGGARVCRAGSAALLLLFLFAARAPLAHAQFAQPFNTASLRGALQDITVTVTPRTPRPFQTVTLSLSSVRRDLSRTEIVWEKDGAVARQGRGVTQFSFTAGKAGQITRIGFSVREDGATLYADTVEINPSLVAIAWEADTYTPPFYRGKALASPEASVRLVALPYFVGQNGAMIDPATLTYTWKRGTQTLVRQSGEGRQVLELRRNNLFGLPEQISVEVASADGRYTGTATLTLTFTQPRVRFYRFLPLGGIAYARALTRAALREEETTFVAEPYFFSVADRDAPALSYEWRIDGRPFAARGSITLQKPSGSGRAVVDTTVSSAQFLLQRTGGKFLVSF